MTNWKSIVGGVVAAVAVLTVAASTMDDPGARPRSMEQVVFAVATFLSVVLLQWLLWRFIVPANAAMPAEAAAFFSRQAPRGFFNGTIGFGYMQIGIYCATFSGYLELQGREGFLGMGLFLIGLGTAARLRDAFSALSAAADHRQAST